jgi:SAM-dependent methyltransferase
LAPSTNIPQRIGGRLQRYPAAYQAATLGLQALGLARRRRQIRAYLDTHERRYLRVGSGSHTDPGWLSVDLVPVSLGVVFMDVTKPFPLPPASFDAVQCEHVIEHIPYAAGQVMLTEIRRVLRPGATLRIATPNLDLVARLIRGTEDDPALAAYVEQSNRRFGGDAELSEPANPAFTANRLVRNWGHTFLYNEATLRGALLATGFSEIVTVAPGESSHPELRGVDRHDQEIGKESNELETLALEATA